MIVRGNKNLETCGIMQHAAHKNITNMDVEHSRVKVMYEEPAKVLGTIDIDVDLNTAEEDMTEDDEMVDYPVNINEDDLRNERNHSRSKRRHSKRHARRWRQKIQRLKNVLEGKFALVSRIYSDEKVFGNCNLNSPSAGYW